MRDRTDTLIAFVVDTDTYAGNFYRHLCAYCTGAVGECGQGGREAEDFIDWLTEEKGVAENPFADAVRPVADEQGIRRPCGVWPTPGRWNDGSGTYRDDAEYDPAVHPYRREATESVAIFFDWRPSDDLVAILKERAAEYAAGYHLRCGARKPLAIRGFRLVKRTTVITVTEVSETV